MSSSYLDAVDPSVELVCVLAGMQHDPELDLTGQLAVVAGWERVISWATALQAEMLVAVDQEADVRQYGWQAADAFRSLGDQLGLALRVSGGSAARRLDTAATLVQNAPAVHEALRLGAITVHHARIAATAAHVLSPDVAQQVAAATVADPDWRTPAQFGDTWQRHVLQLDPEGADGRRRAARRTRRVSRRAEPDGMGSLWALLPAEDNAAVYDRVDACARSSLATNTAGDERTLDERRADALVQLVCGQIPNGYTPCAAADASSDDDDPGGDDGGGPGGDGGRRGGGTGGSGGSAPPSEPTRHGRRSTTHVTVAWSTLIGLDDAPAHLAGYGPIDAATARRIAADPTGVWHRLLTDPASGRLLDYGRTTYRPPRDLGDFVQARDRCCRFPGCEQPAAACDLDHRTAWEAGGTTCADCLDCLCRRHHRLRHQGGWTHTRDRDTGDSWWTDPTGTVHRRPATVLPNPPPVDPPTGQGRPLPRPVAVAADHGPPPF